MIRAEFSSPPTDDSAPAPRVQYAALCWRPSGRSALDGVQILLITSRDTGRWVIPKGWPMPGLTPDAAAAREAWEEAGVSGQPLAQPIGSYAYDKGIGVERLPLPCRVDVYPLQVDDLANRFPERKQRRRKWFSPKKAARKVAEPELQALLAAFVAPDASRVVAAG